MPTLWDVLAWLLGSFRPVVVTLNAPSSTSYAPWLSAAASVVTACIAFAAYRIARGQLQHTRALRDEQARPYVVVGLRSLGSGRSLGRSIYVTNLGKTAAYDVRVVFDPPLRTAQGDFKSETPPTGNAYAFPEEFPVLVPGQTWANFWDTLQGQDRLTNRRYEATVQMKDSRGQALPPLRYVIDWAVEAAGRDSEEPTLGDVVRGLQDIARKLPSRF